jgi:hypothetical protein
MARDQLDNAIPLKPKPFVIVFAPEVNKEEIGIPRIQQRLILNILQAEFESMPEGFRDLPGVMIKGPAMTIHQHHNSWFRAKHQRLSQTGLLEACTTIMTGS